MIQKLGTITAPHEGAFLYFILKEEYLYIGETEYHPGIRLGQHLRPKGSFYEALSLKNPEILKKPTPFIFVAIHCTEICKKVKKLEWKIVNQFIEHALHLKMQREGFIEGFCIDIISSTKKTAPSRCKYEWASILADAVYKIFLDEATVYLKTLSRF